MSRKLMLHFITLIACIAVAGLGLSQTCAEIHDTNGGCAPSVYDGQVVTLTGIVYVVPGIYNPGSVYFNCGGGGAGGMTFYQVGAPVSIGDEITVTGTIGAYYDEIQFDTVDEIVVNSSGNAYFAEPIGTHELSAGTNHMSGFMVVTGILGKPDPGSTYLYTVDDGSGPVLVFVDNTTDIETNVLDLMLGDLVEIKGSTKCYDGQRELLPRFNEDITLIAVPGESSSWGVLKSIYR